MATEGTGDRIISTAAPDSAMRTVFGKAMPVIETEAAAAANDGDLCLSSIRCFCGDNFLSGG